MDKAPDMSPLGGTLRVDLNIVMATLIADYHMQRCILAHPKDVPFDLRAVESIPTLLMTSV